MKVFVFLALFLGTAQSFAGFAVGSGGYVLQCKEGGTEWFVLLDHFEAEDRKYFTLDMGDTDEDPEKKVSRLLNRLEKINPTRARLYRYWLEIFAAETDFTTRELMDVNDTALANIPTNCKPIQAAVQQDPGPLGDKRYTIRKDVWSALDNNGRAGLMLHEFIYRELSEQRPMHTTSRFVRNFNALISSTQLPDMTLENYYDMLVGFGIATMDTQFGLPIKILDEGRRGEILTMPVQFKNANQFSYAEVRVPFGDLYPRPTYSFYGEIIELVDGPCLLQPLQFNEDGTPICLDLAESELNIRFPELGGAFYGNGRSVFHVEDFRLLGGSILRVQMSYAGEMDQPVSMKFIGQGKDSKLEAEGVFFVVDLKNGTVKALKEAAQ